MRVDTPEMHAVYDEIRTDIESVAKAANLSLADPEYMTAAAIVIAREVGDHMLQRRPVDVDGAVAFATRLMLQGVGALTMKKPG